MYVASSLESGKAQHLKVWQHAAPAEKRRQSKSPLREAKLAARHGGVDRIKSCVAHGAKLSVQQHLQSACHESVALDRAYQPQVSLHYT